MVNIKHEKNSPSKSFTIIIAIKIISSNIWSNLIAIPNTTWFDLALSILHSSLKPSHDAGPQRNMAAA